MTCGVDVLTLPATLGRRWMPRVFNLAEHCWLSSLAKQEEREEILTMLDEVHMELTTWMQGSGYRPDGAPMWYDEEEAEAEAAAFIQRFGG